MTGAFDAAAMTLAVHSAYVIAANATSLVFAGRYFLVEGGVPIFQHAKWWQAGFTGQADELDALRLAALSLLPCDSAAKAKPCKFPTLLCS